MRVLNPGQRDLPDTGKAAFVPLLANKALEAPSVFLPENLLREGRRQRGRTSEAVPEICILDPDGDIVRFLTREGLATDHAGWGCYHTELWVFDLDGRQAGVVGCAVGAPFAVLIAEQLFASGCSLLISVTSAGMINEMGEAPYFVVLRRSLRDEGTSMHYTEPSTWSTAPGHLVAALEGQLTGLSQPVHFGDSWTTDAPYRETDVAIAASREMGVAAVEMEAAALYAFAAARSAEVICVAHVTNSMATEGDDFEKGEADGAHAALAVAARIGRVLRP